MSPVLYSFRRCPYAMRARLALAVSQQAVELREIVLRNKPAHMLEISPKGTVPVLQLEDGRVIDESLDVMLWALEANDPEAWLQGRERSMELIRGCDQDFKQWLDRYKYFERHPDIGKDKALAESERSLALWNQCLIDNGGGLVDAQLRLADYAIFPFVRQFARADWAWFETCQYAPLRDWMLELENSALFKSIMPKFALWDQQGAGLDVRWEQAA